MSVREQAGSVDGPPPALERIVAEEIVAGATLVVRASCSATGPQDRFQSTTPGRELGPVLWAREADDVLLFTEDGAWRVALAGARREQGETICGEPVDVICAAADPQPLDGAPPVAEVAMRLSLMRAEAIAGAIEGVVALTREHVTTREQFGAPLIRIPAVAANLAQMRVALLQADAALSRAREQQTSEATAIARIVAAQSATDTARIAHQLHGAVGVTGEHPLHRLTRRLWCWRDADEPAHVAAARLGARAAAAGEQELWDVLTAAR